LALRAGEKYRAPAYTAASPLHNVISLIRPKKEKKWLPS
jgi:hypothetical protein